MLRVLIYRDRTNASVCQGLLGMEPHVQVSFISDFSFIFNFHHFSMCQWYSLVFLTSDINECDRQPCHAQATCTNTEGSFICVCDPGYSGNGFICIGKLSNLYLLNLHHLVLHLSILWTSYKWLLTITIFSLSPYRHWWMPRRRVSPTCKVYQHSWKLLLYM